MSDQEREDLQRQVVQLSARVWELENDFVKMADRFQTRLLEAQELRLVNAEGVDCGGLTFDRDGRPCLLLNSANNRYALGVQAGDGSVGISVMDRDGNVVFDCPAGDRPEPWRKAGE